MIAARSNAAHSAGLRKIGTTDLSYKRLNVPGIVRRTVEMPRKKFLGYLFELMATKKDLHILNIIDDCGEFKKGRKGYSCITYVCFE
jgi:hypothetical protein